MKAIELLFRHQWQNTLKQHLSLKFAGFLRECTGEITEEIITTSMHSSGMRTARLLTVSQHALPGGGKGGVYPGVSARGVSAYGLREGRVSAYGLGEGAVCLWSPRVVSQHAMGQTPPPPVDRQTPVKT